MDTGEMRFLTAAEFANAVNLSDRQIRRLMRSGRLQCIVGEDRIARIPESEISCFRTDRHVRLSGQTGMSVESVRPDGRLSAVHDTDSDLLMSRFLPLHERALKLLEEERQERLSAQESARRAEGQLLGLQQALQSYQRALTENAESIAERESLRQVAEYQAQEAILEREQVQVERDKMLGTLKLAHERISWLEKRLNRLPRWVRRWLESG